MKRSITWILLLVMVFASVQCTGLALNYNPVQTGGATFETLEEARLTGPVAVQNLEGNVNKTFVSHPVLDSYPEGTTFVYRSADMYGGRAAARMNTNLLVFSDQHFDDKDSAFQYIKELGLTDLVDEAKGSVVLVTPINPAGYTMNDQKSYYALQTAMLAQKEGGTVDGQRVSFSDAEYFGGFGFLYVIAIGSGATYFNDYIATIFDYASRIAGVMLVDGTMAEISDVACLLPAYMVNPTDDAVAKYRLANDTDALRIDSGVITYYHQDEPVQKVVVDNVSENLAAAIAKAYYEMFIYSMRIPVVKQGMYTAGTPYQGYGFDEAPYALFERTPMINDVTPNGIVMITHQQDDFADIVTARGEYLQTWYEYVPQEVLDGKVLDHSVPLVMAYHGGSDDPRGYVEEIGWLNLVGKERFILVAPERDALNDTPQLGDALGALVKYVIEEYPAIDTTRIYSTGYSKGGAAAIAVGVEYPELIAAIAAMAPADYTPQSEDEAKFETLDIPYLFTTSSVDKEKNVSWTDGSLSPRPQNMINNFMRYNEMPEIEYDFETYPIVGFATDGFLQETLNHEHESLMWYKNNAQGVPMVAIRFTRDLIHALYPAYAKTGWDVVKHYSRDDETGEIIYNPNVD